MLSLKMPEVSKVYQRPYILISSGYYVSSPTSITSIGSSLGDVFFTMQMHRTLTSVSGTKTDFYIIYKIAFSHISLILVVFALVGKCNNICSTGISFSKVQKMARHMISYNFSITVVNRSVISAMDPIPSTL